MEANLSGANLHNAQLVSIELRDPIGKRTGRMWPSNLTRATLIDARLAGADFTAANLTDANLRGADLDGVVFSHAIIDIATLRPGQYEDSAA